MFNIENLVFCWGFSDNSLEILLKLEFIIEELEF